MSFSHLKLCGKNGEIVPVRLVTFTAPYSFHDQLDPVTRDLLALSAPSVRTELRGLDRAARAINLSFGIVPNRVRALSAGSFQHLKDRARTAAAINAQFAK